MKIAIGADHAGYKLKMKVKVLLESLNYEVMDFGTDSEKSVDYPDFAVKVARSVSSKECEFGILFCGTGIGMAIAANKIPGIRAAVCHNEYTTEMSRWHNDANVFCAGARVLEYKDVEKLILLWLKTPFEGNRHKIRVEKINKLDTQG